MEQCSKAERKFEYVGDADYLVIDEVKTEPLDDNCPSDVVKENQRKIHTCAKCEKTLSSRQSLCRHEKICIANSTNTELLNDDKISNTQSLKRTSSEPIPDKPTRKVRRDMYCATCDK